MKKVVVKKVSELEPGDCLSKDVNDRNGNMLMAAGATVSEKMISMLEARTIDYVLIEQEVTISKEERERLERHIAERLDRKFALVVNDPDMMTLREAIRELMLKVCM